MKKIFQVTVFSIMLFSVFITRSYAEATYEITAPTINLIGTQDAEDYYNTEDGVTVEIGGSRCISSDSNLQTTCNNNLSYDYSYTVRVSALDTPREYSDICSKTGCSFTLYEQGIYTINVTAYFNDQDITNSDTATFTIHAAPQDIPDWNGEPGLLTIDSPAARLEGTYSEELGGYIGCVYVVMKAGSCHRSDNGGSCTGFNPMVGFYSNFNQIANKHSVSGPNQEVKELVSCIKSDYTIYVASYYSDGGSQEKSSDPVELEFKIAVDGTPEDEPGQGGSGQDDDDPTGQSSAIPAPGVHVSLKSGTTNTYTVSITGTINGYYTKYCVSDNGVTCTGMDWVVRNSSSFDIGNWYGPKTYYVLARFVPDLFNVGTPGPIGVSNAFTPALESSTPSNPSTDTPTTPKITASDGITSGNWHTGNVTLTFSGSTVSGGTVKYYWGYSASAITNEATNDQHLFNEDINETVYVKACNSAALTKCSSAVSYVLKIDKTVPVITGTDNGKNAISVSVTENGSGVKDYCVNTKANDLTGCTWKTITTKEFVTVQVPSSGTYYVHVRDNAGNVGNSNAVRVTYNSSNTPTDEPGDDTPSGGNNNDHIDEKGEQKDTGYFVTVLPILVIASGFGIYRLTKKKSLYKI